MMELNSMPVIYDEKRKAWVEVTPDEPPEKPPVKPRVPEVCIPIGWMMEDVHRIYLVRTLEHFGGNKQKTARVLGLSRRGLYNLLAKYRIE